MQYSALCVCVCMLSAMCAMCAGYECSIALQALHNKQSWHYPSISPFLVRTGRLSKVGSKGAGGSSRARAACCDASAAKVSGARSGLSNSVAQLECILSCGVRCRAAKEVSDKHVPFRPSRASPAFFVGIRPDVSSVGHIVDDHIREAPLVSDLGWPERFHVTHFEASPRHAVRGCTRLLVHFRGGV